MSIGKMDKRITFQEYATIRDKDAVTKKGWKDVFKVWAEYKSLRGREFYAAAAVNAEKNVKFRVRARKTITNQLRIVMKNRIFEIEHIDDSDTSYWLITCKESVGNG